MKDNKKLLTENTLKTIFIAVFIMSLLIANVVATRLVYLGDLFGLAINVPGAVLVYGITFLSTDILSERYGKRTAMNAVKAGFVVQIMATILITITVYLPVMDDPYLQMIADSYKSLFAFNAFIVLGSLTAYYISQSLDVHLFHKLRQRLLRQKWARSSTTIVSQFVDTIIFIPIAFALPSILVVSGALPLSMIPGMILGQYLIKVIIALCDTPIFYLVTGGRYVRPEGEEDVG